MAHPVFRNFPFSLLFSLHPFPENHIDTSNHFEHKISIAMCWRQLFLLLTIKLLLHGMIFVIFLVRTIGAACKPTYRKMEGTPMQFGPHIPHIQSSL
jgi:hypothetical protein